MLNSVCWQLRADWRSLHASCTASTTCTKCTACTTCQLAPDCMLRTVVKSPRRAGYAGYAAYAQAVSGHNRSPHKHELLNFWRLLRVQQSGWSTSHRCKCKQPPAFAACSRQTLHIKFKVDSRTFGGTNLGTRTDGVDKSCVVVVYCGFAGLSAVATTDWLVVLCIQYGQQRVICSQGGRRLSCPVFPYLNV